MKVIRHENIRHGLLTNKKVSLTKEIEEFSDYLNNREEIGIVYYPKFTVEKPHYKDYTEYFYVLKGSVKVFFLDTKKEEIFSAGDFFSIESNSKHILKAYTNTELMFIKPPMSDKEFEIELPIELEDWTYEWWS